MTKANEISLVVKVEKEITFTFELDQSNGCVTLMAHNSETEEDVCVCSVFEEDGRVVLITDNVLEI